MKKILIFVLVLIVIYASSTMAGEENIDEERLKKFLTIRSLPFDQGTQGHAWEGAKHTYHEITGKDPDDIQVPMPQGYSNESGK